MLRWLTNNSWAVTKILLHYLLLFESMIYPVQTMKDVVLHDNEILVSYDVESLCTNVPVEESISICKQRLRNDYPLGDRTTVNVSTIVNLLRCSLTTTSFRYDDQ